MCINLSSFDEIFTPKKLSDFVFNKYKDVNIIEHCINGTFGFPGSGKNGILLYGDVGTGKSALAKLLPDLIEQGRTGKPSTCARFINVQLGNNSSELIVKINNQCELIPFDSFHYFVLDEVDNLITASMSSLKVAMNAGYRTSIFILTTNHLAKIDKSVKSRCHLIDFNPAPSAHWLPVLQRIFSYYGITGLSNASLLQLIHPCNGNARDILDAVKQVVYAYYANQSAATI